MAHAEGKITIDRPIHVVFDFLLEGKNNSLWRPSVLDVTQVAGTPTGVGARYKQGLKGPGGRIDGDYEIVESKPNEWIKFQVIAGPARPTGSYRLEALGNSTQVTFTLDFQPSGLARLMDGIIARTMQSEVQTLSNLKAYLERQPG